MKTLARIRSGGFSWFEGVVWLGFGLGLVGAVIVMVRLSSIALGPYRAFAEDYSTFEGRVEGALALHEQSPLWSGITVQRTSVALTAVNGPICADSLLLSPAIRLAYPSLREGGFLFDQVARFNDFRRRQLEVARSRTSAALVSDLCGTPTPSIFVPEQDEGDIGHLTSRLALENLRVPAPTAARPFEILGRPLLSERTMQYGLISHVGTILLGDSGQIPGSSCAFTPRQHGATTALQCFERGGPKHEIELASRAPDQPPRITREIRGLQLRVDGTPLALGRSQELKGGDLLRLWQDRSAVGPTFALARLPGLPLGGVRWINGRNRWVSSLPSLPPYLRDALSAGALFSDSTLDALREPYLNLTVDPKFTVELNRRLNAWAAAHLDQRNLWFGGVVVADVKRGAILGIGEVGGKLQGERHDRAPDGFSWLRQPVPVGSAIKPVLAAAILDRWPELGRMEVYQSGSNVASLGGVAFGEGHGFEAGCHQTANAWIGLRQFLACSSNLYAATLAAVGMANHDDDAPLGRAAKALAREPGAIRMPGEAGTRRLELPEHGIKGDDFNRSGLVWSLDGLFDLDARRGLAEATDDPRPWDGLAVLSGNGAHLTPRPGSPARILSSRLDLMPAGAERAPIRLLAAYSIGTAENRVTLFRLLESYLRIVTSRNVTVSMVQFPEPDSLAAPRRNDLARRAWYGPFMQGLGDVFTAPNGTATRVVGPVIDQLSRGRFRLLGKTGTIGDDATPGAHLFSRTLVAAIAPPSNDPAKPLDCGVVAVIYFRFRSHTTDAHLRFMADSLLPLISEQWGKISGCGGH